MKKKEYLFYLIKSLSKSEKGYLKKFAKLKSDREGAGYLTLFDLVENQMEYDEGAIKGEFSSPSFVRNFSSNKNYLFELILKSLRNFHSDFSKEFEVNGLLRDIKLLYVKRQLPACRQWVERAKKISRKFELFPQWLECINWEYKLVMRQEILDPDNYARLEAEEEEALSAYHYFTKVRRLFFRVYSFVQEHGVGRNESLRSDLEKFLVQINEMTRPDEPYFIVREFLIAMESFVVTMLGRTEGAVEAQLKTNKLMEDYPHMIQDRAAKFLFSMLALARRYSEKKMFLSIAGLYEECERFLKKLPAITREEVLPHYAYQYSSDKNSLYIKMGAFNRAYEQLPAMQKQLQKYMIPKPIFPVLLTLQYAYIYFGVGEYSKALKMVNGFHAHSRSNVRDDLHSFHRILEALTHFELGHWDLLTSKLLSAERYLKNMNTFFQTEKEILRFLRSYIQTPDTSGRKKSLSSALERFTKIFEDPTEGAFLGYFDLISWLESKLGGQSFAEIIREKARLATSPDEWVEEDRI